MTDTDLSPESRVSEPETDRPAPDAVVVPEPEQVPEPEAEAKPDEPGVTLDEAPASNEAGQAEEAPAEEEEEAVVVPALAGPGDWYVVHTYAGYENKVKANLHSRIGSMQMEDKIFDVVIPMEDVMEIKGGKKQVV